MSRAQENMPVYIMSGILLIYGLIAMTGSLLPTLKYLGTHKSMDLQVTLCFTLSALGFLGAVINSVRQKGNTLFERFFLQPLARISH